MLHDCIYQFLRLFYHSRFKPPQLEMTISQFATPVIDLVLVLPLILRLFKDFSRFSNSTKMMFKSKPGICGHMVPQGWIRVLQCDDPLPKFLIFSPFFITSMSCLTKSDGKIRLAILCQAKTYRKNITHEIINLLKGFKSNRLSFFKTQRFEKGVLYLLDEVFLKHKAFRRI